MVSLVVERFGPGVDVLLQGGKMKRDYFGSVKLEDYL